MTWIFVEANPQPIMKPWCDLSPSGLGR